ncbi:YheC/YheD family protein [Paenibacillus sp. CAU 1782]
MSVKRYASTTIRGKQKVCRYMGGDSKVRSLVPHTLSFSRENLFSMIEKYPVLYIKPDIGSLGIGIFRLKRGSSGGYRLKEIAGKTQKSRRFKQLSGAYEAIESARKGRLIIQQGIPLAKVGGRAYDIRAMVQRKPGGPWVCTGFMVKIGGPGKIVTNYYQGGKITTLRSLHDQLGLTTEAGASRKAKLTSMALDIARCLSKRRSGMSEMGIDFAYDSGGKLWVLEVNSNHPQFHPIRSIDPDAYQKMKSFAASYGRFSAK